MAERSHLVLPLVSSMIYVLGALWMRRAADLGVGVWRTTFVANAISALLFAPLLFLGGPGQPWNQFWQPALLALFLVMGQLLGFLALTRGDVTVATPVLGVKTIAVAALTTVLLGAPLPWKVWVGAALSSGAIALLSVGPRIGRRRVGFSIATGLLAAAVFATFDVLVQKWSPAWGAGRLVPLVVALCALFSVAMVPMFREPLARIQRPAWLPLLMGSVCASAQGMLLITTVAVFGDATAVNIVYALRSLWLVIVVWWVGHWFHNTEQALGGRVLRWRLGGAALMSAAVLMAVW